MFKNLKSLFIEVDSSSEKTESGNNSQPQENEATDSQIVEPVKPSAGKSEVDQVILDKLFKALETNNQEGFDYMEYRKALQTLSSLPMDESVKFQSAFATASTMGITLDKLLNSINFYLKVLQNEEDHFLRASQEQFNLNVEGKAREKEQINQMIIEKSKQIQQLTAEITQLQDDLGKISGNIDAADQKIKTTKLNFESTISFLRFQMQQDIDKLKQYIR